MENHKKVHTGEKPNRSDESDQQPSNMLGKNDHIQTQVKENSNTCEVCEKVYRNPEALKRHFLSHKDDILLKCTECDMECINVNVLSNHNKNKHNIFICKECNYKDKSEKNLTVHINGHICGKFKCTKCEYIGKSFESLTDHMKNHTGGKTDEKLYSETVKSPLQEKIPSASNSLKRGLSLSPEVVTVENKMLRSHNNNNNNINKKE